VFSVIWQISPHLSSKKKPVLDHRHLGFFDIKEYLLSAAFSYYSSNLISIDLISSELSGCEVTHFAAVATNQNGLIGWRHVFGVSQESSLNLLLT